MKINLTILDDYINKGLVEKTQHPNLPISIYNYTRQCQYAAEWDKITLMCRGLIVENETGIVVARSFSKFFNYEEICHKNIIPFNETFWMSEKLDGSMLILFHYNDMWHTATKASFGSEQAIKGMEILLKQELLNHFSMGLTYVGEVIYPENKIVVDYGDVEKVIFTSAFETETGKELSVEKFQKEMIYSLSDCFVKYHKIENLTSEIIKTLKLQNIENAEGYVFRTDSGFRFKAKFEDYVRLHKIITNCTSYDVWENLMNGTKLNLENIPDEFDAWLKLTESNIQKEFDLLFSYMMREVSTLKNYGDRKQVADHIIRFHKPHSGILFLLYDNKTEQAKQAIWKLCKPVFEKPKWNSSL